MIDIKKYLEVLVDGKFKVIGSWPPPDIDGFVLLVARKDRPVAIAITGSGFEGFINRYPRYVAEFVRKSYRRQLPRLRQQPQSMQ
jgi:hypothetical protein